MTDIEKKDILYSYCGSAICADCKLNVGGWERDAEDMKCLDIDKADTADLDRALELIGYNNDTIEHPAHYNDGKIEVIDYIEDKKLGFCLGNAIKYISRAGKKDPTKEVEDLKKAAWYINRRIKELEGAV